MQIFEVFFAGITWLDYITLIPNLGAETGFLLSSFFQFARPFSLFENYYKMQSSYKV